MNRRTFVKTMGLATAASMVSRDVFSEDGIKQKRPNLLFVITDQHSWDMLGCYGNSQVSTPHLDRFAGQGIRFNHCVSTSPVCSPMRANLLTGNYALKNAVVRNSHDMLCRPGESFGEILKQRGYRTGYVGKWHLQGGDVDRPVALENRFGFEDYFYSNNCHVNYHPDAAFYYHPVTDEKIMFNQWEQYGQTSQAMEFLDGCDGENPFALFVSWHPPHNHTGMAYDAPDEFEALYPLDGIELRPDAKDQRSEQLLREYQGHMALISSIDECFGTLMNKLEERGLDENTLVVFTSDHGDLLRYRPGTPIAQHGNGRFRMFKAHPLPTACQTPLLMRWPAKLETGESDLLFGSMDFMPTLLGLLGISSPKVDGRDLSAAIRGRRDDATDYVPMAIFSGRGWRGIYTRDHVYSFDLPGNIGADRAVYQYLIDHRTDPYGLDNGYGRAELAELQRHLHERTLAWMAELGDEGWNYNQICEATLVNPGDVEHMSRPGVTMKNKGRPIDLLRASGVKGRFS